MLIRLLLVAMLSMLLQTASADTRDPMTPMTGDRISIPKKPDPTLNIRNAVIMGITKKQSQYIALVKAANGRVHFMKQGDRLYDGTIFKIDNGGVTFAQGFGKRPKLVRKNLHPFRGMED